LGLGLGALLLVGSGCNLTALPYFLWGPEPSDSAQMHRLATDDKEKRIRVAVLVSSRLEVREELSRVDRELSALVVKHLSELCKHNEENVEVLPVNVVERYKTSHPDWDQPLDLARIGQELKVKYVVYLEVNSMSLYVPRSNNQFYQGEVDVKVTLVNARKPDDLPEEDPGFHELYPSTPISTFDDPNPVAFRHKFLDHVAERIAWKFTAHPTEKNYPAE
jgi:hypothetical protein